MNIELVLIGEDEPFQITNLLGVSSKIVVHSADDGEMKFANTERLRVKGKEQDAKLIKSLLKRKDVDVYVGETFIFHRPDWNRDFVNRMCTEAIQ